MKVGQKDTPAKWDNVLQIIRVDENPGTTTAILFQDVEQLVR
jgi:hypothetical protein